MPLFIRLASLLVLPMALASAVLPPAMAHPDHHQVNHGAPAAPDHEHPHQGQQPH